MIKNMFVNSSIAYLLAVTTVVVPVVIFGIIFETFSNGNINAHSGSSYYQGFKDSSSILPALIIIESLVLIAVGFVVFLGSHRARINFGLIRLITITTLYLIAFSLGGNLENKTLSELFLRLDYMIAPFMVYSLYGFIDEFLGTPFKSVKKQYRGLIIYIPLASLAVASVSTFSNHVVSFEYVDSEMLAKQGALFPMVYMLPIVAVTALGFGRLIKQRSEKKSRRQINGILLTFLPPSVLLLVSSISYNFFGETTAKGDFPSISVVLAIIIFVFLLSRTLSKYKIVDFRPNVYRALGYSLATVVMFMSLLVTVIYISNNSDSQSFVVEQQALFIFFGFSVALLMRPLKRIFDSLTDQLFYRSGYNSNELIGKINKVLNTEFQMNEIISKSIIIIEEKLRPDDIGIIVFNEDGGLFYSNFLRGNIVFNVDSIKKQFIEVLLINEHDNSGLSEKLNSLNVEIIAPIKHNRSLIGLLILGPKKTGSRYSRQDMKFLNLISGSYGLSLQNAKYLEQISQFADKLKVEVDEKTKQLKRRNKDLRILNKSKDEFISMTSHQLRPQLTAARGFLSLISEGKTVDRKDETELIALTARSLERMSSVLSDLLNVARLQEGEFGVHKESSDLASLVLSEANGFKPAAAKRGIKINVETPNKLIAEVDWVKIREVLFNLIDNAVQYSHDNSEINIKLKKENDSILLTVTDYGIGVPVQAKNRMFKKFFRANNAKNVRPSGSGVGLFVAKKIIEAHGGSVIFKSEEGKGSTFGLYLKDN